MAGLFQRAFAMDPGAYQRGAESQLRLEALQRAETERRLQQQYGPGNLELPDLGQLSQSRPQINVPPPPEPKPAPAPAAPKAQADVSVGTPVPQAPAKGTVAADQAAFMAPKESTSDLDFYFTNKYPNLFETPADPNDPESFATGGIDTAALYNARKMEAQARQFAAAGAYDRADKLMEDAKKLRQGKGYSPAERIEALVTAAEDTGFFGLGGTNVEASGQYIAQAREMYNELLAINTPESLAQARAVATKFRRQLGVNEADIPAAPTAPATPAATQAPAQGQQMVAPNQNATVENLQVAPAAAPTPAAPAAPTSVQSSNTGNWVAANVPPGITQTGTPVPQAGVKTAASPSVVDQNVTKPEGAIVQPNSAFYMAQPSAIGFDLRRGIQQRQELAQLARIARTSGNMDRFYKLYAQLQTADQNLYYLNGMQGLADLDVNSTGRAEGILRHYSGTPYTITSRSDGKFELGIEGQEGKKVMESKDLTSWLRGFFDTQFRAAQTERAVKRGDQMFEAQIDIYKEQAKIAANTIKDLTVEELKGANTYRTEQLKQMGVQDLKVTPEGAVVYRIGGRVFRADERVVEMPDGTKAPQTVVTEIPTPQAGGGYTAQQYQSAAQ